VRFFAMSAWTCRRIGLTIRVDGGKAARLTSQRPNPEGVILRLRINHDPRFQGRSTMKSVALAIGIVIAAAGAAFGQAH
jgi:hypothetical protein